MKMCYWFLPKIISFNCLFYRSLAQPSVQDHRSASLLCSRCGLYPSARCVSLWYLTLWSVAWRTCTSRETAGIFISFYPLSHCLNLRMNEWIIIPVIHFAWNIHGAQRASAKESWQPGLSNDKGRQSFAGPPECSSGRKRRLAFCLSHQKWVHWPSPRRKPFTL